ncbi:MAG: hypothetical protein BWY42_00598 [Candidatus Omnitrophica bacterium ADurb.Bin277]|nr:MAG: hypothetical protein BWY42_00598 [Candidatus Omnitrophica bacterium ADurb.Bin277]
MGGFLFFQLSNEERESAIRYLLEAILKVRDSDPELARGNFFDEDVNVYLAHLLFAMSLPEYHDMADPFLSSEPKEITEWVKQTDDPMLRYFIYKVNADHRLVHSTIFSDRPAAEIKRIIFRREENGESRLAVAYYDHASRYHKGIYHKRTGVGEVLDKIAARFDVYSRVLFRIREDYFQFVDCFREQAFRHFFLKLERYEKESRKDLTLDRFLEAYQKWLSLRTPEARRETLALAGELAEIDPNFRFDPSKLG